MKAFEMSMKKTCKVTLPLLALMGNSAYAQVATGNFATSIAGVRGVLQTFLNFMVGPWATAVVAISVIVAFATWFFAPREGIVAPVLRVVVAGLAIMNTAAWIFSLGDAAAITL